MIVAKQPKIWTNPLSEPFVPCYGNKWQIADWINFNLYSNFNMRYGYSESFGAGYGSGFQLGFLPDWEGYNEINPNIFNLMCHLKYDADALAAAIAEIAAPQSAEDVYSVWNNLENLQDQPADWAAAYLYCCHHARFGGSGRWLSGIRPGKRPDWDLIIDQASYRMQRIKLHNLDAIAFMLSVDSEDMVFYVDPPYLLEARLSLDTRHQNGVPRRQYEYELGGKPGEKIKKADSRKAHLKLLNVLQGLKGGVMLSGYRSDLYDDFLTEEKGWKRVQYPKDRYKREHVWIKA